jgi:hypothetical protein
MTMRPWPILVATDQRPVSPGQRRDYNNGEWPHNGDLDRATANDQIRLAPRKIRAFGLDGDTKAAADTLLASAAARVGGRLFRGASESIIKA